MRRVLVTGSGGREHALAWACRRGAQGVEVLVAPGNGGTEQVAENVAVAADDARGMVRLARERDVDLVVLGPDASVAAGVADALAADGIACCGPSAAAGRLESSKRWARQVIDEAGVPAPRWRAGGAADRGTLLDFARDLGGACVVKADGLALGKGVIVCDDLAAATAAVDACLEERRFGSAGETVLVEERLSGPELSILALTDGEHVHALPPARDHKRAGDGDTGPNTGGMGAYGPVDEPGIDGSATLAEIIETVVRPVLALLRERGTPFRGCLFTGVMLTPAGPRVLEFNARFGDPEAQVLLPLLDEELVEVLHACATGGLTDAPAQVVDGAAVGVVAASAGYPGQVRTGLRIDGLDAGDAGAGSDGVHLFHAGTRRDPDGTVRTAGGRVLAVVARAPTRAQASRRAYEHLAGIHFEGMWHRDDIGVGRS